MTTKGQLRKKATGFQPQTNGFAFINSWQFEPEERRQMIERLGSAANGAAQTVLGPAATMVGGMIVPQIETWIAGAAPENFGLCGGMACAALDYYAQGKPTPRGRDVRDLPTPKTPDGAMLRSFILDRQLQSMALNFPRLIGWMIMLHLNLPMVDDGPGWLLARSKEEWAAFKRFVDGGSPRPLMLVGSSTSPFNNHQVLGYAYDDPGDGTGTIYIYDMNCPNKENHIAIDMRGALLQATETCADERRGPLRGFFVNEYQAAEPPAVKFG